MPPIDPVDLGLAITVIYRFSRPQVLNVHYGTIAVDVFQNTIAKFTHMPAIILSFANLKGAHKACIIDFEPQANLTTLMIKAYASLNEDKIITQKIEILQSRPKVHIWHHQRCG